MFSGEIMEVEEKGLNGCHRIGCAKLKRGYGI